MNGLFGGGNGTSTTPYLVEDILDLNAVRNNLSAYYRQTQNIEFNGTGYDVTGWTPIGNNTTPFTGNYDGGNYKIRNMYIRDTTFDNYGLFGKIAGVPTITKVSNIILENVDILECSINPTGALAGLVTVTTDGASTTDKVIIENCHISGYIRSKGSYCGGLIGIMASGSYVNQLLDIYRCSSAGYVDVNGTVASIGGLVGSVRGTNARVRNSYSTANVTANNASAIGGLIGETIDNYPMDYIEYCFALGNVIGYDYVGGFIGWNGGNSSTTIRKSYAKGNVTALYASNPSCGGFIGYKRARTTSECYSIGHVSTPNHTSSNKAGGFIGQYTQGTNSGCLWDKDTSGKANAYGGIVGDATGIYGKTTAEMKQKSTYVGLGWSI